MYTRLCIDSYCFSQMKVLDLPLLALKSAAMFLPVSRSAIAVTAVLPSRPSEIQRRCGISAIIFVHYE